MQGKKEDMTNEQSAKNVRVPVAVKKELLSLQHRFGERTSCEGRLTTQFRLVNSGKILSRNERRQMSTPYCYRAWTAFLHFLIRFTRAIQRNEKSWDTLFLYGLAVAPLRALTRFASLRGTKQSREKTERQMNTTKKNYQRTEHWSIKWLYLQMKSEGEISVSARKAF